MSEQPVVQPEMTDEEKEGVKAIIFLQAFVGIKESETKALSSWRDFSPRDKVDTLRIYALLKG
jgi:hypothetical protein